MATPETDPDRIKHCVEKLPEVYQPIYGHPEFTLRASRACDDRLAAILRCYDALAELLGRPLKVLDLGCAQGYFGFSLAARGAQVHGVDQLEANIELCRKLAAENPRLQSTFEVGSAEEAMAALEPDAYDLILGLSVLHHVIHARGQAEVSALIERASFCVGALLLELALREEPLYWAPAQPADPRELLARIGFVREIGRFQTHLSDITRPLYVSSNRYWIFDDLAGSFERWSDQSHALAGGVHRGSRRYFFGQETIVKHYRFDHTLGEANKSEFANERWFADHAPPGFALPAPMIFIQGRTEGWVRMRRRRGSLLLDRLRERSALDHRAVLLALLDQLVALEKVGLYHSDVRTWNILVGEASEVYLLDLGSISARSEDRVWPENLYLSFLIFVRELVSGVVDDPHPLRLVSISPFGLPQPYRAWAQALWHQPLGEWSFQVMRDALSRIEEVSSTGETLYPLEAWMRAAEEALQIQKRHANYLERQMEARAKQATWRAGRAVDAVQGLELRINGLEERAAASDQRASQAALATADLSSLFERLHAEASMREQEQLGKIAELESELELSEASRRASNETWKTAALELDQRRLQDRVDAQRLAAELERELAASKARLALLEVSEAEARRLGAGVSALRDKLSATEADAARMATEIERLKEQVDGFRKHIQIQEGYAASLRFQVNSMLTSKSWRLTRPLRGFGDTLRNVKSAVTGAMKGVSYWTIGAAPSLVAFAVRLILRKPVLRARFEGLVARHPHLRERLKSVVLAHSTGGDAPLRDIKGEGDLANSSVLTRQVGTVEIHEYSNPSGGESPRTRRFLKDFELASRSIKRGDS